MGNDKDNLTKIDLLNYKIIDKRKNNKIINNIKECYINNITNELEVYFNKKDNQSAQSTHYTYNSISYSIEEKTQFEKLNSLFNYFYEISKHMKSDDSGQYDKSFLHREYDKINDVEKNISQESIAFLYAQGNSVDLLNHNQCYIYPFKTNYSQYQAMQNAFSYKISVIEGPPGTGKTQTILNLIANIITQGKTVAVVSSNNSAFENVYNKLKEYKYDFICARLGNNTNKENFITQNNSEDNVYPNLYDKNRMKSFDYQGTCAEINCLIKQMLEIFALSSERAKLVQELENVNLTYENVKKTLNSTGMNPLYLSLIRHIKSKQIHKFIYKIEKSNKFNFFMKFKLAYIYKIGSFNYISSRNVKEILDDLTILFFELRIQELDKKISFINNRLSLLESKQVEEKLESKSLDIFNYTLIKRYKMSELRKRKKFTIDDLSSTDKVYDFLQEYPVILSTTDSIRNSLNLGKKLYDYIIIDEASQANLVSGFLALTTAKNLIIVGDNKQLSHIIEQNLAKEIEQINQYYTYLVDKYNVIKYNLLTSVMRVFQIEYSSKNKVLLKEHYRCHPKIIEFCNKQFYNEELVILSENKPNSDVLRAFITSKGNHAINSKDVNHINYREVDVIKNEILPVLYEKVVKEQIGIIAPYKNQKELLISEIDGITINTVHSFQGQEMDAIIITTVDNEKKDFSDANELINVAVSRARKYLYIVTSDGIYHGKQGNIKDLISYIQYNLCQVDESKIKSIFDILYQENDDLLNEYIRKQDKNTIKQHIKQQNDIYQTNIDENKMEKSEIIGYFEIKKYIKEYYPFLNMLVFIPLKVIININAKLENPLSEEEIQFINADSHIDFLLINKFNKQIFLAIEIDGYYFHSKRKQKANDEKKKNILQKYNIELKRFSTRGSEELKELDKKIKEIIETTNN